MAVRGGDVVRAAMVGESIVEYVHRTSTILYYICFKYIDICTHNPILKHACTYICGYNFMKTNCGIHFIPSIFHFSRRYDAAVWEGRKKEGC